MKYYNIEIFKQLDQSFEQEFIKYGKRVSFKKKDTPFLNDELFSYFYIVLKGKIKNYQINLQSAKEQTLFIYRQGDMFDTLILLDSKKHDVLYEVLEDSELLELPIEKVREWLRTNEQFNRHFFPYLASQMRHTEELASDLSLYSTLERLSKLLLQNIDPNDKYHFKLLQNLSQIEIANLIGTIRHVVERHIKKLQKDNIIKKDKKNIFIKDIDKLLSETKQLLLE
jgi:CRP-like cAMP-binding protein